MAVVDFVERIEKAGADADTFFYYSSHGVGDRTDRRENYLTPIGATFDLLTCVATRNSVMPSALRRLRIQAIAGAVRWGAVWTKCGMISLAKRLRLSRPRAPPPEPPPLMRM
jgi:hypothetical protein